MEGLRFNYLIHALADKCLVTSVQTLRHIWNGFDTMANATKLPRFTKKIGTHNGVFHCDEALACFMLKQLPEYGDANILRTRDCSILETCDVVVDVGGEYNPKTNRYDHHQRDFCHTLHSIRPDLTINKFKTIKLSSAGLVYAHFGIEVISEILKKEAIIVDSKSLLNLYSFVYEGFVEEIDAIDNGIPMYSEGKPRYTINTHLSARINRLNPDWNSPEPDCTDELFKKAMEIVGHEFLEKILFAAKVWWPARKILQTAIENRKKVHEGGEIIMLETRCPWNVHLQSLEEEMGIAGQLKFCIFSDKLDSWRVQAIPLQPGSFISRVILHKDWCGLRDEELSKISGIENCIFCHATGFIGGNKTQEGCLEMALQSIKANENL